MANNTHAEPVICPQCSELIIVVVRGGTVIVPAHPDLSWPQETCTVSDREIVSPKILL